MQRVRTLGMRLVAAFVLVVGLAAITPARAETIDDVAPRRVTGLVDNGSYETQATVLGNRVVFQGFDNADGFGYEPWITDGTPPGTHRITILTTHHHSKLSNFTTAGSKVFFTVVDEDVSGDPEQLWVTDGSAAGTKLLASFPSDKAFQVLADLTAVGRKVFFNVSVQNLNRHLWVSDGTRAGTKLVKAFPDSTIGYGGISSPMVGLGAKLYFQGYDPEHGSELWTSDGTATGTRLAVDTTPGTVGTGTVDLMAWQTHVLFTGNGGLYSSDGTPGGTVQLTIGGQPIGTLLRTRTQLNGKLFLTAIVGGEQKMVVTDGTQGGTTAATLPAGLQPRSGFAGLGAKVVFGARVIGPDDDEELWVTDGTTAGTKRVKDIYPGLIGSAPDDLLSVGHRVFFDAQDPGEGRRLFVTDGTSAGTHQLGYPQSIGPLINASFVGGMVFFDVPDGPYYQPWLWEPGPTYRSWCALSVATTFRYASRPVATVSVKSSASLSGTDVSLYDEATRLGTTALVGGKAQFRLPTGLSVRKHQLRAIYPSQGRLRSCNSVRAVTVTKARPTVSAKLKNKTVSHRAKGSLTVTVTAANVTPTGRLTVTVTKAGKTMHATLTASSHGRHTFGLPRLGKGTWSITTKYGGSKTVAARNGNTVTLHVT